MNWTSDQKKVIETRNKDILVSAAAGSGKTAVLVERIIQRITDKDNPVNVDQMLIVTFTKAAASQMREKIRSAIEKRVRKEPDNEHLTKQLHYIRNAMISTIDGFCAYLLKNYYDRIDLNPGFRVGDEAEIGIIKSECIKEVLEKHFELSEPDFLDAVGSLNYGHSDDYMEYIVMKLYDISTSHVNPREWLMSMAAGDGFLTRDTLDDTVWIKELIRQIHILAKDNISTCKIAISMCEGTGGPYKYISTFEDDIMLYEQILKLDSYEDMLNYIQAMKFSRIATISKKDESVDNDIKERVKAMRDSCKKEFDRAAKAYFSMKIEDVLYNANLTVKPLAQIALVTLDYMDSFAKKKEEKNIVDFSDIEHFALDILTFDKNPLNRTPVAYQLGEFYEEILIDEYQDSNDVQEAILSSIAHIREDGSPYMFMVGDVKQSIYGFRMAKPDLFIGKADTYCTDDSGKTRRIDLHMNFRSRSSVIDFVNYIFGRCMTTECGRIEYDENEMLHTGATYPDVEYKEDITELLIYNTHVEKNEESDENEEDNENEGKEPLFTKEEAQIRMIAQRIRQLVDKDCGMDVTDTDSEGNQILRKARYSDIVILFRSMSKWTKTVNDIFSQENIPVAIDNSSGYFKAKEIQVMLNMLRIICNPLQDIPFVSVLRSPIGEFSDSDIALIRSNDKESYMYDVFVSYADREDSDTGLKKKVTDFLNMLEGLRKDSVYLSLQELILKVYDVTGYYDCVLAMSDGKRRRLNLDMLTNKAEAFENTSYNSLTGFISAMDKLDKYTIDISQAGNVVSSDCVTVMTIHKSKGLEFPICIVAGLSSNFNIQDAKDKIVISQDVGLSMDYVNYEHRVRTKTLSKQAMSKMIKRNNIDEELRVFYVALTRAKEKLILAGAMDVCDFADKNLYLASKEMSERIPSGKIISLSSYMELVMLGIIRTKALKHALDKANMYSELFEEMTDECPIDIIIYDEDKIVNDSSSKVICDMVTAEYIKSFDTEKVYNQQVYDRLVELSKLESYIPKEEFKAKVSVSEMKKLSQLEAMDIDNMDDGPHEVTHIMKLEKRREDEGNDSDGLGAADIGTMYHKIFEIMPLKDGIEAAKKGTKEVDKLLFELASECALLNEYEKYISTAKIQRFLVSPLAQRMADADDKGTLYREQQFVLGVNACDIYKDTDSSQMILVQGIIDAFFEENGKIILMDYKTDRVSESEADKEFVKRYKTQLDLYENAIERLTHKKVAERIIYSVALGREIAIF